MKKIPEYPVLTINDLPVFNTTDLKRLDKSLINAYKMTIPLLMETAGLLSAKFIRNIFDRMLYQKRIIVTSL